jgi:hypothetical protein
MCSDPGQAAPPLAAGRVRRPSGAARLAAGALLAAVGFAAVAAAHPMSHSLSRLAIDGWAVTAVLSIDLLELGTVDRDGNSLVSVEELDAAIDRVYALVREHYRVRAGRDATEVRLERYEVIEDGHIGRLHVRFTFDAEPAAIEVTSTLDRMTTSDHRHLVSIARAGHVEEAVLDRGQPSARFDAVPRSRLEAMRTFVSLGVEHIFTGYDHLAFLVCLLLGAPTVRALVLVVTSFTIAHSLTLALATFDVVVLPSALVESLIALSIAYVAVENLLAKPVVARYRVTFFFGLIHGFGFSNILREMALPRANLALSLFSFNAGVEIGQVIFVIVLFPLLAYLPAVPRRHVRHAASFVVFGLAVYWFAERALLG